MSLAGVIPVAAKKAKPPKGKAGGEGADEPRKVLLAIKGRQQWKVWLEGMAAKERVTVAALIDRALAHYAEEIDYAPPPER
jgi:hypothetical protein